MNSPTASLQLLVVNCVASMECVQWGPRGQQLEKAFACNVGQEPLREIIVAVSSEKGGQLRSRQAPNKSRCALLHSGASCAVDVAG